MNSWKDNNSWDLFDPNKVLAIGKDETPDSYGKNTLQLAFEISQAIRAIQKKYIEMRALDSDGNPVVDLNGNPVLFDPNPVTSVGGIAMLENKIYLPEKIGYNKTMKLEASIYQINANGIVLLDRCVSNEFLVVSRKQRI